jgi:phosphate transport system substrate-binding protein
MQATVAAYGSRWNVDIEILAQGSKKGIDELVHGTCDIAMSSTDLSADELSEAGRHGVNIKSFVLAHDEIVPIVNKANPVTDISLQQLRDIFAGRIKTWSQVGGGEETVMVVVRDVSSGTCEVWKRHVGEATTKGAHVISNRSNSAILASVAESAGAIGYVSSAFLNAEVKALHVHPPESASAGQWEDNHGIKRSLYLYVNEERLTGEVKKFILFLLMTREGKDLIAKSGFFPIDYGYPSTTDVPRPLP